MSKVVAKNRIRRNRILRTLLEQGETSLTELSRSTGISLPMVSRLVTRLRNEKFLLIAENRNVGHAGRPPIMVKLNGDAGYVLGIDMGHVNTNILLLNLEQNIVGEVHRHSLPLSNDPSIIDGLAHEIDEILRNSKASWKSLLGIGVSLPGIVRGREGISESYLHFGQTALRDTLQERFKKTVHIEHDAKAMALGERWFGAAKNVSNALCLNVGWGLGLGIILDGKIYYGRDGYAGEFGHIQVADNGKLCQCGKRGCLETVASGRAIADLARERLSAGAVSKLKERGNQSLGKIDAAQVVKAAISGDQFSIEILEEAGRYLGEGIAKLINIFNPELVILGGRVAGAKQFILDPVRAAATKQSLAQLNAGVDFRISELGTKSGALGVAMLAARDLFEVEHLNPSALV